MIFSRKPARPRSLSLSVEALESRLTPFATSGNIWPHPELITLSFVPDGAIVGSNANGTITNNLFATMNARYGSPAAWQKEILRAAQVWAQQTNINFKVIADNGTAFGNGANQQGDSGFGDIRIGGYNYGAGNTTLAEAYSPPPVNNQPWAGDVLFNTGSGVTWNNGGTYDLYTVAVHEIGHALGLYHSGVISSQMYGSWGGVKTTLTADDIAGVRSIYSADAARANDTYDATANGTVASATNLSSSVINTAKSAAFNGLKLVTSDIDYYKVTAPTGTSSTFKVKVQSDGLSLLRPKVEVFASNGTTLRGSATTATTDYDGATLTVSVTGVTAGAVYYVKVSGAETGTGAWQSFNTGAYGMTLNFGTGADPALAFPNTTTPNAPNASVGGGQATKITDEIRANTNTTNDQFLFFRATRPLAMDSQGRSVMVWTSLDQDGSGKGVYGQRYDANGAPLGSEFRVNTTTVGDQWGPTLAMNASGAFVVVWASTGQDGSGEGVYAQRYNASGVAQGSEFRVNVTTAGDQVIPSAAMDANGNFVVTWETPDAGGYADCVARSFNASGTPLTGEIRVNTTTALTQVGPTIAMDPTGNYVIVWTSQVSDGSFYDIYGQRFLANGTKTGTEFRVNTTTAGGQYHPRVAMNGSGNFVVVWEGAGAGDDYGIYAQRYSSSGATVGSEFRVNTKTTNVQENASVALADDGNFLISWLSGVEMTANREVVGQQYNASGAPLGTEFRVTTTSATMYDASTVAMAAGKAIIAWSGIGASDTKGIFFQRYNTAGGNGLNRLASDTYESEPHDHGAGHDHHRVADHTSPTSASESSTGRVLATPPTSRQVPFRNPVADLAVLSSLLQRRPGRSRGDIEAPAP